MATATNPISVGKIFSHFNVRAGFGERRFRKVAEGPASNYRRQLLVETTASSHISDLDRTDAIIVSVQKPGHKLRIDYFGSGAVAFQYLRALRADSVKIDSQDISQLNSDLRDLAFVKAIRQCADNLGSVRIGSTRPSPGKIRGEGGAGSRKMTR